MGKANFLEIVEDILYVGLYRYIKRKKSQDQALGNAFFQITMRASLAITGSKGKMSIPNMFHNHFNDHFYDHLAEDSAACK